MKITNLDLLDPTAIDGSETMPVVKTGKTWRARLADLTAPMVSAAQAARAGAETALANTQAVAATLPYPLYASTAAAQADGALAVGKVFTVASGGQILIYTKTSSTASSQIAAIPTATYTDRLKSPAIIPTVDLGARGTGTSAAADQAGYAAAIAALAASASAAPTGTWDFASYANGVLIEPGIYDAGGLMLAGNIDIKLMARIPGTVIIRIPAGQYFLTCTGRVNSLMLDGIKFVGGKGALLLTNTGNNVNLMQSVTNCFFYQYTECALANNAADHPYLRVRDNVFYGASGSATIGIAWGGYVDNGTIEHNAFLQNAYHIKIGPRLSSTFLIHHNDLISWGGTPTVADIWIVPNNTDAYGVNSGRGTTISGNKFGNEGIGADQCRILIANEDPTTGTGRQNLQPFTGTNDYSALTGLVIAGNLFVGGAVITTGSIIRSYIGTSMRGLCWEHNRYDASSYYAYVVEFKNGDPARDYTNTQSEFVFSTADLAFYGQPARQFCNATTRWATLRDFGSFWPGDPNAVEVYPAQSDDPRITPVIYGAENPSLFGTFGASTTATAIADPNGFPSALLVTTAAGGSGAGVAVYGINNLGGGASLHIDLLLARAPANSVSRVVVDLYNYVTGQLVAKHLVTLPATGMGRFSQPVSLPASASPSTWQLRTYPYDWASGTATSFVVGWVGVSKNGRYGYGRPSNSSPILPRNRALIGVATGAPGTLPSGFTLYYANGLTGIASSIVNFGADQYGIFFDLRLFGTATHAGNAYLRFESAEIQTPTDRWAVKFPVRLINGSQANITMISVNVTEINASGGYITDISQAIAPNASYAVYGTVTPLFNGGIASILPGIRVDVALGAEINMTLRVYTPSIYRLGLAY